MENKPRDPGHTMIKILAVILVVGAIIVGLLALAGSGLGEVASH